MANLPLAFGEIVIGGVILMTGLSGKSIGQVINGQFSLSGFGATPGSSLADNSGSSGTGPSTVGSGSAAVDIHGTGQVTPQLLQQVGAPHGWSGQEIADWNQVISMESGGNPHAVNPSSGAAGIAQFINGFSEYFTYGGNPNTVQGQLTAMANYIKQRYGSPSAALAHEQQFHWY